MSKIRILNDVSTYNTFDIELWQYPYNSAENIYNVEPFSEEHLNIMRWGWRFIRVLGHAITTTISEEAWSGQTYISANDVFHYPSMIKWTKT